MQFKSSKLAESVLFIECFIEALLEASRYRFKFYQLDLVFSIYRLASRRRYQSINLPHERIKSLCFRCPGRNRQLGHWDGSW